ncbi:fungal-specific transcription factor domain-containing protein [Xylariales sp. AK1849]|nr:fungal-specific transcription factor domain-containing protein [Xylariales sp. AK1849]
MSRELASRSTHGCWTCRLRKKKCDENRPSCFRCTSLHIVCDGYGPRPYWMDRGDLQRAQARYKTRIIAQVKSAMRETDMPGRGQHVDHESDTGCSRTIAAPSQAPVDPTQETLLQSGLSPERDNLQLLGIDGDFDSSNEPMSSEALSSVDFSTEIFYDQIARMNSYDKSPSSVSHRTLATSISPVAEDTDVRASLDVPSSNSPSEAVSMDAAHLLCDPILSQHFTSSKLSGYSSDADWSLCEQSGSQSDAGSGSTDLVSPPGGLGNPIMHGDVEDILFMYYLEHVFYVHCPFYFPSSRQGRGWLLSILKRANSAYHAALALSEYHHSTSTQHGNSIYHVRTEGGHYDLALQELHTNLTRSSTWGANLGLAHIVEVLTTILHLLFYQSCSGGRNNWQMHLAGANALLPLLVQAQMGSATARKDLTKKDLTKEHQDRAVSYPDTSISFLLGFFIHVHIITCASTRSSQFLVSDHRVLLETGHTNLSDLIGCKNWAMISIFDISSLDKWKKAEEDAHRLSLIELTKRGGQIEERLLIQLASIENNNNNRPSKRAPVDANLRSDFIKNEITRIFALSAITYLHVVISGPHPNIPDIKRSVSKTIDALESLPDPKFLPQVVWPYCISGCLAADEQQQKALRELVTSPRITHGACLEALSVMEECWRLRKAESSNQDWASIMERRGQDILLI